MLVSREGEIMSYQPTERSYRSSYRSNYQCGIHRYPPPIMEQLYKCLSSIVPEVTLSWMSQFEGTCDL
jgi:hypothetical protein